MAQLTKQEKLALARGLVLRALCCTDWHFMLYTSSDLIAETDRDDVIAYAQRISKYIVIPPDLLGE